MPIEAGRGEMEDTESVRLDRWLWAARWYKTRSSASRAVNGGKVQLNGRRPKPASALRVGDEVRVRRGRYHYHITVQGLSERRGPAREASKLYEETEESRRAREALALQLRSTPEFDFRDGGRPTKKERRALDRLKGYRKR